MRRHKKRRPGIALCLASGLASGLAYGGVLQAAENPAAASAAATNPIGKPVPDSGPAKPGKGKIEEITVTSQKRSENVRKVPLSVTVLSGAQIRQQHIQNYADLTRVVPNLSFSSQAGEGLSTLEIRGISSAAGTATVALYLDDVSLTTRNLSTEGTVEPRFLDISRVEVLRGPQSTLYGASALGGTLRYISNQPKLDTYEGNLFSELSGTYHGTVNWDEQGVVNIPLVQNKLALRLAAETGGDGGYITQVDRNTGGVVKDNINSTGFDVVKGTLLWTPTDWLTITPSMFWQHAITRDVDAQYLSLGSKFLTPKTVAEPGKDDLRVPSLTINADLGFANLIAVTGNYERQFTRTLDSTAYDNLALYVCDLSNPALTCPDPNDPNAPPLNQAPPGLYKALDGLPSETFYSNTVRQWSEEIRLVSKPYVPGELPVTWIAGLYYSDEHTTSTDTEYINGSSAVLAKYNVDLSNPNQIFGAYPGSIVDDNLYHGVQSYDTAQYAVFGEGTYYPRPNIRLTAGARYQFSRDGQDTFQNNFFSYGNEGLTTAVGHFYAFLPKFAVGWDITPQNTIYANASKGFRLGSENRRLDYIPAEATAGGTPSYDLAQLGIHSAPTNFGPDKLWNFEVGDKARWFSGRLQVNADFFYIAWKDIQTSIPLETSGDEFQTNAGSATSYGTEIEIRGQVNDNLTLGVSGSILSATLDHGVTVNGNLIAGTFPGENIPGVPEFNVTFDARHNFQITDAVSGFVAVNLPWTGKSHGDVLPDNPDYNRPSYLDLNASAGIDYGRWEFTLFGRNLTNNNQIIQRPDIQGSASSLYNINYLGQSVRNNQGFTLRPLTIGMNASVKF